MMYLERERQRRWVGLPVGGERAVHHQLSSRSQSLGHLGAARALQLGWHRQAVGTVSEA
jgi:hypothetical protein